MEYRLIHCDSLLKKITKKDILFNGTYCIDPYQNCEFGCLYCDSSFDKTIYVKKNAVETLENELQTVEKGVIIVGSVHDPYQKAEQKYEITKKILKTIKKYHFPCHILTKSTLVLRDISLLSSMNCMVTISILSLNENVYRIFEENVPPSKERLQTIKTLANHGIKTGAALIPILPYIVEWDLEHITKSVKNNKAHYLLHKHLELKGEQKQLFINVIQKHYPHLLSTYDKLYKDRFKPDKKYISEIDMKIQTFCRKYNISEKILQ